MAQEKSLADCLVFFMQMSGEASAKIDALPHDGGIWPQLGMMIEQQDRMVRDALFAATMTATQLGRIAAALQIEQA